MDIGPYVDASAVLLATALGLLVPLIASILPIKRALTGNLHDSLDSRRSQTKAVVISIERTKGQGISVRALMIGLVLTAFGFGIYYFLPLALVNTNITLLFNIFLILLVGMMLGLVLLALNLESVLERALVWLFSWLLWFENKSMPLLVIKNLVAHRLRNRKTSLMYAFALGFIIFLTVAIRIELASLEFRSRRDFVGQVNM